MSQTGKLEDKMPSTDRKNVDLELKIARLKQQKTVTKSALTKSKNKLLALIDEETPVRKTIRETIEKVSSLQCKAMGIIVELSEAYTDVGEIDLFRKTCKELEPIEDEIGQAIETAEIYLKNTLSSSQSSVGSGIRRLFKSDDQSVQSSDSKVSESNSADKQGARADLRSDTEIQKTDFHDTPRKRQTTRVPKHPNVGDDMWKQLKRVSIPVFHGKVQEYEGWKAAFMACVDRSPATNEYKLLQLKQYLGGEAAQLVSKLGHSAVAYDIALERLDRKYGGRRRQVALQLEEIANFRPIRSDKPKDLDRFADMLDVSVVNLREHGKVEELGDGCLYSLLKTKMTEQMIIQYQRWVFENQRQESVETLREWVLQEAEFQAVANETKHGFLAKQKPTENRLPTKFGNYFGTRDASTKQKCNVCGMVNHETGSCRQLKSLDISKRWDKVKQLKLCFRCLGEGHLGNACALSIKCGIDGCSATHNRILHSSAPRTKPVLLDPQPKQSERVESITMSTNQLQPNFAALRTIPVVLRNNGQKVRVNALLDDASSQTYLNEDIANKLNLKGPCHDVSVSVLNSKTEMFSSMNVEFCIESIDGSVDMIMSAMTTTKVTGKMPVIDWKKNGFKWAHLVDIPFPKVSSPPIIDLLIGMDYIELHSSQMEVHGLPGEPVARKTPLGWTCVGTIPHKSEKCHQSFFSSTATTKKANSELDSLVSKFWEIEEVPSTSQPFSQHDKQAVDAVEASLVHENGRYKVAVPWKGNPQNLPNNYQMAYNRLVNTEKKLAKDKSISAAYDGVLDQYMKKGYIRKVPEDQLDNSKWFLPHFPVVKLDRTTTKVRIVFDASAKSEGTSLNDVICQGPKLQGDLFSILVHFRKHPIAIICDISEMYLQIEVAETDRPFLRFLWRFGDDSRQPDVYEFQRVVFGMNCSPFLAQHITQEHARKHEAELPLGAKIVLEATYMDDSMTSVETEEEALEVHRQLMTIWNTAGMRAHKWVSNSKAVVNEIPLEDRLHEMNIQMSALPSVKTLGLLWNAETDMFRFAYAINDEVVNMTKRSFLRETAKLFDPLGLLAPFIIRAKVLLQKMWIAGVDWDEPLNQDLNEKVCQWYKEIKKLPLLVFSRYIGSNDDQSHVKLHIFVDASEEAYGAVVYAVSDCNGSLKSELVSAKSRVAPLKATSVPRLELMAAVLGVKLGLAVAKALDIHLQTATLWSDSQNVLWWVKNQSRNFKPFVSNRVGYIQENSNPSQWNYVPTEMNPADLITKGTKVSGLSNTFWTHGPEFINKDESDWPDQPVIKSKERTELRKSAQIEVTYVTDKASSEEVEPWRLDPSRFSSWTRLCRVTAWTLRFVNNLQSPSEARKHGELDAEEIQDAEHNILLRTQREAFSEHSLLVKGKSLPSASNLLHLKPVLDDSGLLRSSGRLKYADVLSNDARFPIILPRHHSVTQLIVKHFHEKCNHSGTNVTLAHVSTKFWILSAREAIRDWEKSCTLCKRRKSKPMTQVMGDLPKFRITYSLRAFDQVGVDFAGPFLTKQGRGKVRQKRYLCLFTCLTTRAVHLEMAFGLDTDSFLNAFFRMVHRRGLPKVVVSDNGTNFVGANKELKELVESLDSTKLKSTFATKGVRWRFNPPHAPHFGGVFESLIKSAKRSIFGILGSADLTDEDLMTAFTGAEAMMNSRPLTYQSAHPNDDVPLTPNHFLHGQCGGQFAPDIDDSVFNPTKRWRRVQDLVRHVWRRWMSEWLTTLNSRKKWLSETRDVRIGDVVILVSSDTRREYWPLGRIVQIYPGKDGHVRVVDVKVGESVLTRPVTKLCPLESTTE